MDLILTLYEDLNKLVSPLKPYYLLDVPTGLTFNNYSFCPHNIFVFI